VWKKEEEEKREVEVEGTGGCWGGKCGGGGVGDMLTKAVVDVRGVRNNLDVSSCGTAGVEL